MDHVIWVCIRQLKLWVAGIRVSCAMTRSNQPAEHPLEQTSRSQAAGTFSPAEKQLYQAKRLYATLSQVNQTIVRVKSRDDLYQSICDVAVQYGEFMVAWIGLLDEQNGDIRPVGLPLLRVKLLQKPLCLLETLPILSDGVHFVCT